MTSIKFTIPGRLPGMNEYQAACRRHRMAGAAMKKTAMISIHAARVGCDQQYNELIDSIRISIHAARNRRENG